VEVRVVVGGGAAPGFEWVLQNLSECKGLRGLPEGLSALTALQTLKLRGFDISLPYRIAVALIVQ
jgi:hypothetical protein